MTREEYGRLYHQVFGEKGNRKACREGWERWQQIRASGLEIMILHPHGTPPPAPASSDHLIVATTGPLRFLARISAPFLPQLPQLWLAASADSRLAGLGSNPRSRARAFIHNSLVDGYVMHPAIGPAVAGAIAWLLSTVDGLPIQLSDFHLFGYDISAAIAGPPGQKTMFNFRAMHPVAAPPP